MNGSCLISGFELDLGRTLRLALDPLRTRRSRACRFARRAPAFHLPVRAGVAHQRSRVSACRGGRGCTPRSWLSSSREGRGCTPRSCLSACREGRGCTPRSCLSPCREGRGCTLRSGVSASREGRVCTPCSCLSACRAGIALVCYSSFVPHHSRALRCAGVPAKSGDVVYKVLGRAEVVALPKFGFWQKQKKP